MLSKLEDAKAELLDKAAEVGEHIPGAGEQVEQDVAGLLRRYYRHVAAEDLLARDPVDIYGAALSHRQLAEKRSPGSPAVRVFTPTVDHHGWTTGHTVVEMVIDDMPFLVDSVSMELSRQDRAIHLVVHPQMVVRRSFTGELIEVCGGSTDDNDDAIVESWIHVEIDRESDRDELDRLATDLQRVLHDVREAVEDWQKMRQAALDVAEELANMPPPLPEEEVSEAEELLRWLVDEHFTFLGYREYVLEQDDDGHDFLRALPGTGLGILRSDKPAAGGLQPLSDTVSAKARERQLLILTKANSRATVHRPSYLDYVGVKRFDEAGNPRSERRFLGLFSHTAYNESISRIPVLRRKTAEVLERSGFPPNSHSGKDLQQILETYPRDELFQTSVDDLLPIARSVLYLQERRQLRLFLRKDDYGRFISCLVYLPRERYTTQMRLKMQEILQRELGGANMDYTAQISESVLARVHFVVRMAPDQPLPDADAAEIEKKLVEATRTWVDDFGDAALDQCGEESAARLAKRYAQAFPEAYKEDFPARTAVADLLRLEALRGDGALGMNLYEPFGARQGERRFKLYRIGGAVSLTHVLPRLQDMGVEVIDERPYEVTPTGGPAAWIYDFGLRYDADQMAPDSVKEQFQEAFAAVWRGDAESDGFNALVLRAGLSWRQTMVLRAYAKYLRQAGTTFSQEYIEQALVGHVHVARLLVQLFEALLDPTRQDENGGEVAEALVEEINGALDDVASLDQDRILRAYLRLIQATLRTNYFQRDADGALKPYLSVKFEPQAIPELPQPRPRFEIWVYSPLVEGVHLRFGPVARGGLRWSDRREDFRTEVLGLVKAQAVKNAVIVPVGAKGGFVVKQPQADPTDREAVQDEGISRYKTFISGMLDITDNLRADGGKRTVLPPDGVVRRDGDDPYLVVAADKGTATFSDIANSVAKDFGFWLGDAFASGGSAGYDHKAMGITARGAWESVKRHFREMGRDIQQEDFTVVGVGDMSGDVFGNGMLLSRHIRLLAAFDHRHIFLDPNPDAETSFTERERLFALPRSSWADYDSSLISEGGGVLSRTAKSLKITPQVQAALGLPEGTKSMTPAELMRGIIAAPVDLFWNGGIGTYVKATAESNADVGDKANDAIRVNGSDLQCKAIGEGGNLGMTQLGRIEYARHDGAVNTDAIDNSAGVDTSDHEVNIKILLDRVARDGDLTEKQRDTLLAEMTDEVGQLVLKDNYGQNVAIATALVQGPAMLHIHARYMRDLEDSGHLNRELEFLPDDTELAARQAAGEGLTGPEFSVLLAYTKIWLAEQLLDSSLPEDPYLRNELYRYFPTPLRERFTAQMDEHQLRREIIATGVVNNFVNNAGTTFYYRIAEETGAVAQEIARAHTVARIVYDLQSVWEGVEALDCEVDATVQTVMRLEARKLSERATRWLLANRRPPLDIAATIDTFAEGVRDLSTALPDLLRGSDQAAMQRRFDELVNAGVPEELAQRVAVMAPSLAALDIVEVAADSGQSVEDVGRVYFDLAERLRLTRLLDRILALPRDDRWKALARAALRDDLYAAHASLTADVLEASDDDTAAAADRFAEWESSHEAAVTRAMSMLDQISAAETFDLATLSVALRVIRSLLRTRSAA